MQLSETLANYQKIDWEKINKKEHPVQKRPLTGRRKYSIPEGYRKKTWDPKTKSVKQKQSLTLLNIKRKADWTFEEWELTQNPSNIGKLSKEQLQVEYAKFKRSASKTPGKLETIHSTDVKQINTRKKVNKIKTTYHVKTVRDKVKVFDRLAQSGEKTRVARSRYHDSMEEVMWASKKIQLRKWHQSVDIKQNSIVFAMDPQVGFRNESTQFSARCIAGREMSKSRQASRHLSVMADDRPDMSIPDFILSSVITPAEIFENDNKKAEDAPIADEDVVIAMADAPAPSLLKVFLGSHTVDLAFGIESDEAVRGDEKYGVFHHLIAMFCVNHGRPPPTVSE